MFCVINDVVSGNKNIQQLTPFPIAMDQNENEKLSEEEQLVDDIDDVRRIAFMVLNSEFSEIIPNFKKRTDESYYHLLGLTIFNTILAMSYLKKERFQRTLDVCYKASEMANKHRKKECWLHFQSGSQTSTLTASAMLNLFAPKC